MPGFITHYLCAQAVLKQSSPIVQQTISIYKNMYNIGAQGPDIFYYYLPGLLKKRIKGVGEGIHHKNAGEFIWTLAETVKKNNKDTGIIYTYTAGFITHYALDALAHPYVYALTNLNKRSAMHNRVEHRKMETTLDVLLLKLLCSKEPAAYSLWQLISAESRQMRSVSDAVSHAVAAVYKRDIHARDVYKSMRYMVQLTRILQSGKGRRKRCIELAEGITLGLPCVSGMIHAQQINDNNDLLNINKAIWHIQTGKNDSFIELYESAVIRGMEMVKSLDAFAKNEISKNDFADSIGNFSLKTGESWAETENAS